MKLSFSVPSMSCGHCKARVEKALSAAGYTEGLGVDLRAKTVSVETDDAPAVVAGVITAAGYPAAAL